MRETGSSSREFSVLLSFHKGVVIRTRPTNASAVSFACALAFQVWRMLVDTPQIAQNEWMVEEIFENASHGHAKKKERKSNKKGGFIKHCSRA